MNERIERLEGKLELEERKKKTLDKFKVSKELRENVKKAGGMKDGNMKSAWFAYKNLTDWNYKRNGSVYEHVGNFNYGATGRAAGYSPDTLLRMGGVVQIGAGTSSWELSNSNFDDPVDQ